ncbi:hydroxymethylbilane synthase [Tersicoccus phoenicis]|uniref:Porphobilinogen deaminase n=1 Tax=Tersicoccus phoenicis TaxID=554083 RepID=A0A1R1LNA4_9MICC|nr:hydroxymethylbilane synthase [Tersicoccus phoenicis]OMH29015.1 hydroxymethylbilane synthase [Tersicoccus phoenicis]
MGEPLVPVGTRLRLGTRGSDLAVTQSGMVGDALAELGGFDVELVRVRTEGDVNRAPLAQIGGTGVFVTALRDALLHSDCDVAVHSLKDLPSAPADGLTIAAVPTRADVRDVLCARDGLALAELPAGARVGTGSPRRAAQLRAARPDLAVVDLRGNVPTRLGRVTSGELDAVVLAAAGLSRLGLLNAVTDFLDPSVMLPAPGQGALAVEVRSEDLARGGEGSGGQGSGGELAAAMAALDDGQTRAAVTAERALLARLEAGCSAPVGALARVQDGALHLDAVVGSPDGTRLLRRSASTMASGPVTDASGALRAEAVTAARELGIRLAETLLDAGAADLIPADATLGGAAGIGRGVASGGEVMDSDRTGTAPTDTDDQ